MTSLRIATFNVNSLRSRLPVLERWLPSLAPDILCLQETKVTDEQFPLDDVRRLGYDATFSGEKSYNGVALLWRQEPDEVKTGFNDGQTPSGESRLIAGRWGDLWVLDTYVPQGKSIDHPDYLYKKDFLRRTAELAASLAPRQVLWVGDLNVAPTPLDVTNPANKKDHVCFIAELRELFADLTSPLVDLFRRFHEDEATYSFFDYRVKDSLARNIGWRIDHMLATPALAERCTACWIDREPRGWEKPSDHTPVLGDFRLE